MKKCFVVLGFCLIGLLGTTARASSILDNELLFTSSGTGPYTFNYSIELTSNSILIAGDFFEIVDFSGFTGVTSTPPLWAFTSPLFTGTVTNGSQTITVPDSAAVPNLRWTYTGATLTNPGPLAISLGVFSAESIYRPGAIGEMMARDRSIIGGVVADRVNGDTPIVPVVPTPAAAGAGIALLGVLGAIRLRRAML